MAWLDGCRTQQSAYNLQEQSLRYDAYQALNGHSTLKFVLRT